MHLILGFLGFAIYTEFVCGMTILVMKYQYQISIQDGVPARNFTLTYETSLLKHRDDGRFGIRVFGQLLGHF